MKKRPKEKYNRIKYYLDLAGKTQVWLAGQLDLDYRHVNRICNNDRQPPIKLLYKIAKLLKVNAKDLLE